MLLTDISVRNRTTVGVLVVLIMVLGAYSYLTLPREAAPDVPIPIVLLNTAYEGVSPEDIESSVTIKIEKELAGLKDVKEIRSISAEGLSTIVIEFMPNVVIEDALQYVRDRVDVAKSDLPSDADEPAIKEVNVADFPIMIISISGELSPAVTKAIADDLEDSIEQIPGVLNVDVSGELEREIRVEIDPDRLASYDLTVPELIQLIPAENVNISAGGLETAGTKFNVRVPAEFGDPGEVDNLLLAMRNGKPIYLADVARVQDIFKDRVSYSRLDGRTSVTVSVQKRVGADILPIAAGVRYILKQAQANAPEGVKFEIIFDDSKYIRQMVADLENNIVSGFLLVAGVLVLFMGWGPSTIVATAVPLSMLISFGVIQAIGYTLNMIVLFSLVLAVGMLVDNAIVVVENVYRHVQLGYKRIEAALRATGEVAWPVTTSTLTTVAAFIPLLFWPGIVGDFMKYLPVCVIITLSSSLFVALVINPTICAVFARAHKTSRWGQSWFVRGYRGFLRSALANRLLTFSLAAMLLVLLMALYWRGGHGVEFFPEADPDRAVINIRCAQGTHIDETDRLTKIVETRLEPYHEDLEHVVTEVGSEAGFAFLSMGGGPHVANLTLVFHDYAVRRRPSADMVAEMRRSLHGIPGAEISVEREQMGPPTGAPVTVEITGKDFTTLEAVSEQARSLISDVPGLVNLRSDLEATRSELVFKVDRQRAMLLGTNTATVGNFLKTAVFGTKVGTFREFNDEYDITVRLPESERVSIEDLLRLQVPNASGDAVPLSSLGEFSYQGGYGTIRRVDQKRVVTLTGDAEGRLSQAVLKDVQGRLANLQVPPGYEIRYAGEKEEEEKAQAFLTRAFVIALLLILAILVAEFNSLAVPFVIMSSVILSLIGVMMGLLICRCPFGIIMTGIGVISLAGVVVNNAIVLLDYTRQLQRRGYELLEAAVEAGATRLRPVLLTAITTILGLLPMATGISYDFHTFEWATRSQSSEWWKSMATTVIFGLTVATILTLVVVPALYVSSQKLARRFGRGDLGKETDESAPAAGGTSD